MPYFGIYKGQGILPPQVPDGAKVTCPACDEEMSVVRSHTRGSTFVSRHFSHIGEAQGGGKGEGSNGNDCPGESEIHHKMKSIAYARLNNDFPESTIQLETALGDRIPDVLLDFSTPRYPYGRGIAVEAQYQNKGKDKDPVVDHYLQQEYSVAWLEAEDFTSHDVDLSSILTVWPHAVPDRYGTEGYPNITQWLWQDRPTSVEIEVPIPADYWMSYDKTGEWVTIADRDLKAYGSARISRSPDGHVIFSFGKASGFNKGESISVQVVPNDVGTLRSFADDLSRKAFGRDRPDPEDCDQEWHELSKRWFDGSPNVTAWITAALPDPNESSDVVVTLWKKRKETERVAMKAQPYAVENLQVLADLLERAFEIEKD